MKYKYLAYNASGDPEEHQFVADNDAEAIAYARSNDAIDAPIQDTREFVPIVYRENTPTSTYGCGGNCDRCNAWIDITEPIDGIHGDSHD